MLNNMKIQYIYIWVKKSTIQQIYRWIDRCRWMNGWTGGWIDKQTYRYIWVDQNSDIYSNNF